MYGVRNGEEEIEFHNSPFCGKMVRTKTKNSYEKRF